MTEASLPLSILQLSEVFSTSGQQFTPVSLMPCNFLLTKLSSLTPLIYICASKLYACEKAFASEIGLKTCMCKLNLEVC